MNVFKKILVLVCLIVSCSQAFGPIYSLGIRAPGQPLFPRAGEGNSPVASDGKHVIVVSGIHTPGLSFDDDFAAVRCWVDNGDAISGLVGKDISDYCIIPLNEAWDLCFPNPSVVLVDDYASVSFMNLDPKQLLDRIRSVLWAKSGEKIGFRYEAFFCKEFQKCAKHDGLECCYDHQARTEQKRLPSCKGVGTYEYYGMTPEKYLKSFGPCKALMVRSYVVDSPAIEAYIARHKKHVRVGVPVRRSFGAKSSMVAPLSLPSGCSGATEHQRVCVRSCPEFNCRDIAIGEKDTMHDIRSKLFTAFDKDPKCYELHIMGRDGVAYIVIRTKLELSMSLREGHLIAFFVPTCLPAFQELPVVPSDGSSSMVAAGCSGATEHQIVCVRGCPENKTLNITIEKTDTIDCVRSKLFIAFNKDPKCYELHIMGRDNACHIVITTKLELSTSLQEGDLIALFLPSCVPASQELAVVPSGGSSSIVAAGGSGTMKPLSSFDEMRFMKTWENHGGDISLFLRGGYGSGTEEDVAEHQVGAITVRVSSPSDDRARDITIGEIDTIHDFRTKLFNAFNKDPKCYKLDIIGIDGLNNIFITTKSMLLRSFSEGYLRALFVPLVSPLKDDFEVASEPMLITFAEANSNSKEPRCLSIDPTDNMESVYRKLYAAFSKEEECYNLIIYGASNLPVKTMSDLRLCADATVSHIQFVEK